MLGARGRGGEEWVWGGRKQTNKGSGNRDQLGGMGGQKGKPEEQLGIQVSYQIGGSRSQGTPGLGAGRGAHWGQHPLWVTPPVSPPVRISVLSRTLAP